MSEAPDAATLDTWAARRERGEPLAWIVGWTEFCGHRVRVEPGVYVPRPHTEELARRAARRLPADGAALDLCCGSGALAVHLSWMTPAAVVVGADVDPLAAACASGNGVPVVLSDAGASFRAESFDVVCAVAPYVPTAAIAFLPADVRRYEPGAALDGGSDGLDVIAAVVATAARVLKPGGTLLLEIGGEQGPPTADVVTSAGMNSVELWFDADGDVRGVEAVRPIRTNRASGT